MLCDGRLVRARSILRTRKKKKSKIILIKKREKKRRKDIKRERENKRKERAEITGGVKSKETSFPFPLEDQT